MKHFIFLTGHRKSGTTLLQSLIDGHPDINVYPTDLTLMYAYFPHCKFQKNSKKDLIKKISNLVIKSFKHVNQYTKYSNKVLRDYKIFLEKNLQSKNLMSEKEVLLTVLKCWVKYFNIKKKKYLLIKETTQTMNYELLINIFRNIKIIQIIRDPRDNYASIKSGYKKYYKKIGYNKETLLLSSIFRIKNDLKFAKILRRKNFFLSLKYEDLVSKPRKEISKILKFCKLKINNFRIHPTNSNLDFYGNSYERDIFGISKRNIKNWRSRINKLEECFINFYLEDEIKFWKYSFDDKNIFKKFHQLYNRINSQIFYKGKK